MYSKYLILIVPFWCLSWQTKCFRQCPLTLLLCVFSLHVIHCVKHIKSQALLIARIHFPNKCNFPSFMEWDIFPELHLLYHHIIPHMNPYSIVVPFLLMVLEPCQYLVYLKIIFGVCFWWFKFVMVQTKLNDLKIAWVA